jgi:hypothetical protein
LKFPAATAELYLRLLDWPMSLAGATNGFLFCFALNNCHQIRQFDELSLVSSGVIGDNGGKDLS